MEVDDKAEGTPSEFLSSLGEALKKDPNADLGLVAILRTYILTASPAPNAVSDAKEAIIDLAT
jgi:hypothetical protein